MSPEATIKLKLLLSNHITTPLKKAKEALGRDVGGMRTQITTLRESFSGAFANIQDEIPGLNRILSVVKNPYVLVTAGAIALGSALAHATNMAMDWEKGMSTINVTAQLTKAELTTLSGEMLQIGARNVAPLEEIPIAFNKIISAGLSSKKSLEALEPTLRAAKAGFVDIEIVAKAGANVMNSSGRDINEVYDVLFATLNKGAAEMGDIANYLPKIVPSARSAGFALGETAGAFAFMTAQGQNAEAATTLLQNAFKSLADPAKLTNFKKMGVNIYDAQGKMLPFITVVEQLQAALGGLSDFEKQKKLATLGLDQQSASAFAVMTQDVGKLRSTIDFTTNSTGQLDIAYANAKTSTDDWKIALNRVKYVTIKIGEAFLPLVKFGGAIALGFTTWLLPALQAVKGFISEWAPVFVGIGIAVAALNAKLMLTGIWFVASNAAMGVATAATWLWNAALAANPLGLIIVGIGALVGGLVVVYKKFEGFRAVVKGTWEVIKGFGTILKDFVIDRIKGIIAGLGSMGSAIAKLFKGDFSGAVKQAKDGVRQLSGYDAAKKAFASGAKLGERYQTGYREGFAKYKDTTTTEKIKTTTEENTITETETLTPADTPLASEPSKEIAGGAKQIKNITFAIEAFNKGGINIANSNLQKMSPEQMEEWFCSMLQRVIRNAEMTY